MIKIPTTVAEAYELSSRHSDAYWFLQGDLTPEQSARTCQTISDIEKALSSISQELQEELQARYGEEF